MPIDAVTILFFVVGMVLATFFCGIAFVSDTISQHVRGDQGGFSDLGPIVSNPYINEEIS